MSSGASPRDAYSTVDSGGQDDVDIVTSADSSSYSMDDHFRGCLGELRVAGVLLPFFGEEQLGNRCALVQARGDPGGHHIYVLTSFTLLAPPQVASSSPTPTGRSRTRPESASSASRWVSSGRCQGSVTCYVLLLVTCFVLLV